MTELRGIAWNHSRGFVPVVATAQRFEELYPDIRITWEKRSLQAFADAPMETLTKEYDLIVMDHPHTALCARDRLILPLDTLLDSAFLEGQARNSVGRSHESYTFDGHQWTLATDAAAPVATWRPDLVNQYNLSLPQSWEDIIDLAKDGFVTACLFPIDCLMYLYMMCDALGQPAFSAPDTFTSDEALANALDLLRELAGLVSEDCLSQNPIRTAEFMTTSQDRSATYSPFAYGYSNYSRPGYARFPLSAGRLVEFNGNPLRSVLGGAGLAVSASCKDPQSALNYAQFTASPSIQCGIYYESGGQPGHRSAWIDPDVNNRCNNYFKNTLETLDRSIQRPKYPGYMFFQDSASPLVHKCIAKHTSIRETVTALQNLFQESLRH